MEAELGFFLLILVAVGSSCMAVSHWALRSLGKMPVLQHQQAVSHLISLASVLCLLLLIVCFVRDDFALEYVVTHSNSQLPLPFKVAAAWGGHQGSMLFWVVTLCAWSSFIALKTPISRRYTADCLAVMHVLIAIFAWFTLTTSNPFAYAQVLVNEGRDLNPMLQDVGLIVHPPLLYLGYVGYAAVLAFALAALLGKHPLHQWYDAARYAVFFAWATLTIGILVGSWWAYNELGWGGWWFWDPVENASLLPWLTGSALLHSGVLAKRHQAAVWSTYALAFATFSLSVLGTFIVRSGVLTSVHAFAVDPTKGLMLLGVLSLLVVMTFGLLIVRGEAIRPFRLRSLRSRAYLLYVAMGLMVITAAIVFLGTFYPLGYQLMGLGNISVGAPYFNSLVFPLSVVALFMLAVMPVLRWQQGVQRHWKAHTAGSGAVSLIAVGLLGVFVDDVKSSTFITVFLAVWVAASHIYLLLTTEKKAPLMPAVLAHCGFALATAGAVVNSDYSYEYALRAEPGVIHERQGVIVEFHGIEWRVGPNYTAEQAQVTLRTENNGIYRLLPEKRHYPVRVMNMTEPAIRSLWHGDYYVTLGDRVAENAYAIKVQYRAGIWWIWSGGLIAVTGALGSMPGRNRRSAHVIKKKLA
ncbi:heme lyase NrfEFG subunit NrfE [Vibrio sp. CAU 1672]|uniref:heme lyase CcmF/NrfE family subunit n=1 Tax=Vibrio sp. CAU 1672 TaxID=3032594 RepID=UPI0023DADCB3|nr:heme lyase NrfEFG subunit NrfE [Vibrio sp. CAU 1672]MDF2154300.1 heme lyase NrfEFG subunit NrfE [Vibrio sp. CAU 1672]